MKVSKVIFASMILLPSMVHAYVPSCTNGGQKWYLELNKELIAQEERLIDKTHYICQKRMQLYGQTEKNLSELKFSLELLKKHIKNSEEFVESGLRVSEKALATAHKCDLAANRKVFQNLASGFRDVLKVRERDQKILSRCESEINRVIAAVEAEKFSDKDADGVYDVKDKCPYTEAVSIVDQTGCPVKEKLGVEMLSGDWSSNYGDPTNPTFQENYISTKHDLALSIKTSSDKTQPHSLQVFDSKGAILETYYGTLKQLPSPYEDQLWFMFVQYADDEAKNRNSAGQVFLLWVAVNDYEHRLILTTPIIDLVPNQGVPSLPEEKGQVDRLVTNFVDFFHDYVKMESELGKRYAEWLQAGKINQIGQPTSQSFANTTEWKQYASEEKQVKDKLKVIFPAESKRFHFHKSSGKSFN